MANEKVYQPETIADNPFPQREEAGFGTSKTGTIKDKPLPVQKTATRLINSILNTTAKKILGEFQFTSSGAIKIGKYVAGESGEIKISPSGIVATNASNETTVTIDGETGDATFKGTVLAGSLISGEVEVGGVDNESGRILVNDASGNLIILSDSLGHHYYDTSANELVKVDWVGLHCYLTDGTKQLKASGTGIEGYGTLGNTFKFYDVEGGTLFGQMGYHTVKNAFYFFSDGGADVYIAADEDALLVGASATLYGGASGATMTSENDASVIADNDVIIDSDNDESGAGEIYNKGRATGSLTNTGFYVYDFDASGYVEKAAVIETSKGWRTLYCMESPEVWFMDFTKNKDKLDPLFSEVTEKPYHFIKTEDGQYQVWGKRKGMAGLRFEEKTREEAIANNKFWATPTLVKKEFKQLNKWKK